MKEMDEFSNQLPRLPQKLTTPTLELHQRTTKLDRKGCKLHFFLFCFFKDPILERFRSISYAQSMDQTHRTQPSRSTSALVK